MLTARKAGQILSCTPDYIGKLCREGKLQGTRVKGAWYVDGSSLVLYQQDREAARTLRSEELSSQRKNESLAYSYAQRGPVGKLFMHVRTLPFVAALPAVVVSLLVGAVLTSAATILPHISGRQQTATIAQVESPFFIALPSLDALSAQNIFAGLVNTFASLFGSHTSQPAPIAAAPVQLASSTTATSVAAPVQPVVQNVYPIQEHTIERVITTTVSGISEEVLTQRLQELGNALRSQIAGISSGSDGAVIPYAPAFRIDKLSNTTISGGSITGAAISGGSISGVSLSTGDLSGVIAIANGGTGTSSAPVYGQLLLGNSSGTYDLVSTSSLGIGATANAGGADGQVQYNVSGALGGSGNFTFDSGLGKLTVLNTAITNATTTNLSTTNASTTNLTVSGLGGSPGQCLTVDSSGTVSMTTCGTGGSSFGYPFVGNATTTPLAFNGGLSSASTTLTGKFVFANATGTNATTTNFAVTGTASTSNLVISSAAGAGTRCLQVDASGTVSASGSACGTGTGSGASEFTFATNYGVITAATSSAIWAQSGIFASSTSHFVSADFTTATTTNLAVTSIISSLLKTNSLGQVVAAALGTDYQNFSYLFPGNATTTSIVFNGGLTSASTTFTGPFVFQNATGTNATTTNLNVSGTLSLNDALSVANGGTGSTTLGGILRGNGTGQVSSVSIGSGLTFDGTTLTALAGTAASSTLLTDANTFSGANTFSQTITGNISGNAGTVTNGVYTTTFNSLFDPRFVTDLAATTSVASINTLSSLSLPYSQLTGTPSIAGYSFALTGNATSTLTQFNGGLTAYASSTIGNGMQAGGLTISGGATTTGNLVVQGTGTSTLAGNLAISGLTAVSGSIVPTVTNTYSLGQPGLTFKDLYLGPGSLFVNGQEVIHTSGSNDVVVSSDPNQNLVLQTSGVANIELNPSGGQILLKNTINVSAGKSITTSDLSALSIPNGVAAGNITVSGNTITATNTNGGISFTPVGAGGVYVTTGNFGIGNTNPTQKLNVQGEAAAQFFTATSTTATNTFPLISATAATTTNLAITAVTSSLLKTLSNGAVVAATPGADYQAVGNYATFGYPFVGNATTTLLAFNGGLTATNATTTSFFSTTASSTNFYGANLATCQAGNVLTWNNGLFGCAADQTSTGAANAFTFATNYNVLTAATSSAIWAQSGIFASSTSHFVSADFTTASTTNLAVTGVTSSLLKTNSLGQVVAAAAGTDYQNFAYLFPGNATTTSIAFNGGLTATGATLASTTLTGPFVFANATGTNATTTNLNVSGTLSLNNALSISNGGTGLSSLSGNQIIYTNSVGTAFAQTSTSTLSIGGNAGTVTNGVYTTTFNSLFDPRFVTDLAATTSVASINTLSSLSLPYSQLTGTPSIAGYPFVGNATSTLLAFNGGLTSYASTTIGDGTAAGGLTVSGGATTTGVANFLSNVILNGSSALFDSSLTVYQNGSNRAFALRSNAGKSVAGDQALLFSLASNDSSNPLELDVNQVGASTQVNRAFNFQTTESGIANGGNILFQRDGG
ncbi:MAG: helix-turn-helix domain-containing protein, partial [Patescibacteria group bacterium]